MSPILKFARLFYAIFLTSHMHATGLKLAEDNIELHAKVGDLVLRQSIHLENISESNVSIKTISPSCSCLKVISSKLLYNAKERGELIVEFTTAGKEGVQEKTINIKYDDGSTQEIHLKTFVPQVMSLAPSTLTWRKKESNTEKTIQIALSREFPVYLESISTETAKAFSVRLERLPEIKRFVLRVAPKSIEESGTGKIILHLAIDGEKRDYPVYMSFIED